MRVPFLTSRKILSFCRIASRGLKSNRGRLTEGEQRVTVLLENKFPGAKEISVVDTSGGCGTMYEIEITADEFKGKRTVLQHRLVNEALGEEVKQIHGFRVKTHIPPSENDAK